LWETRQPQIRICIVLTIIAQTTRKSKKEKPIIVVIKATAQVGKPPRLLNYPCRIYGIVGHKLMNYPRFGEMQNMFKDKGSTKSKPVVEVKMVTASINMVDVNVTTRSKTSEEQMFKDREPRKNKFATNWEVKKKWKRSMVKTI